MKVSAFLTTDFETVEALAVTDILRRAGIDVTTVSLTGSRTVTSAQQIPVVADGLFEEVDNHEADLLFLPGGPGHVRYEAHLALKELLLEFHQQNKRIAAICAAPSVLGRLGILKGKKAICFPGYEKDLLGAEVPAAPVRVVTDGNITTSRGMGTSLDLGLELVRLLAGKALAEQLAVSTQYQ